MKKLDLFLFVAFSLVLFAFCTGTSYSGNEVTKRRLRESSNIDTSLKSNQLDKGIFK